MHARMRTIASSRIDMDRLQAMTTFVTVVETGGFASAARKLEVSPSVVSRVVTELEERLGVRLLTRTTRVVRLTDAGSGYFEDCRRILGEIDNTELAATGTHSSPRGVLSITAPSMFGRLHVTPIVLDFCTVIPISRGIRHARASGRSGEAHHRYIHRFVRADRMAPV